MAAAMEEAVAAARGQARELAAKTVVEKGAEAMGAAAQEWAVMAASAAVKGAAET